MRSANRQNPSIDGRKTVSNPVTASERTSLSYSTEERAVVVGGLGILARIVARAHLRRQESRSGATSELPTEGEDQEVSNSWNRFPHFGSRSPGHRRLLVEWGCSMTALVPLGCFRALPTCRLPPQHQFSAGADRAKPETTTQLCRTGASVMAPTPCGRAARRRGSRCQGRSRTL